MDECKKLQIFDKRSRLSYSDLHEYKESMRKVLHNTNIKKMVYSNGVFFFYEEKWKGRKVLLDVLS